MPHLSCLLLLLLFPLHFRSIAQPDGTESKWESDIQAFEASDQIAPPSPGGLLFVGSSTIRLWHSLEHDLPNHQVIRRGFGGSHLADTLRFVDRIVLPYRPRQIVLYAGDNDIKDGKSPKQVLEDFQAFVARVHAALPETRITFLAIKPSIARWHLRELMLDANLQIAAFCNHDERLDYVDLWNPMLNANGEPARHLFINDELHLNDEGYQLWKRMLLPFISP
jgi:lysophospholipase L1-like esterase